jgi:hypothetical protein
MAETQTQIQPRQRAYQYYTELPSWGKGIIAAGGVLIIWKVVKKIKDDDEKRRQEEESKDEKKELSLLEKDLKESIKKLPLTYVKSQYQTWANQLEEYMQYAGTDKTGILSIIKKMKNSSDVMQLALSFGKRKYLSNFGVSVGWKTLGQFFAIEDSWLEYLVYDINNTLKNKGIKYRF